MTSGWAADAAVFDERAYVDLVRACFLARLLSLTLAAIAVPPEGLLGGVLVISLAAVSFAGIRGDWLARQMLRHPICGTLDALLTVATVTVLGADTPVAFAGVCSALLVGLLYRARYAWPLLVVLVAGSIAAALPEVASVRGGAVLLVVTGLPALYVGLALVGAAARRGFAEAHQARLDAAGALAEARAADERARLARDMHDSLGKTLHGIGLAAASLAQCVTTDPERAVRNASDLAAAAEQAAAEARSILLELREGQDDRPLAVLLGELCRDWSAETGVPVELNLDGVVDLDRGTAEQVRLAAAEALHNVAKHADASTVRMVLRHDLEQVQLEVSDDGRGFEPRDVAAKERHGHFGIRGMRERAEALEGSLWIDSEPGAGTTMRWVVPMTG